MHSAGRYACITTRSLPVKDVGLNPPAVGGPAARAAATAPVTPGVQRRWIGRACIWRMDKKISNGRFHFCDTRFTMSCQLSVCVLDTVIDSLHMATIGYVRRRFLS